RYHTYFHILEILPIALLDMRRFERINNVVESVEDYRIGGYHPVHLGDLFHQRYEIIGKLAFGQFSTVWLARDQRLQRDVTLKILKSAVSEDSQELSILNELSHSITPHAGKEHVISLLDHFEHEGPNGLHLCLVFPIMMSDGEAMTIRGKARNASFVRAVSTQIIIGLDFLHQNNMIHGGNILNYNVKIEGILIFLLDLQPANILFTVKQARHRESLVPPEFSPVRWLPGITADSSAPRYLMTSQRPRGMLDDASFSSLVVKIGDLGGAIRTNDYRSRPVTPLGLGAPEIIEGHSWDSKIDIWALGCLIFQLATNEALFPLMSFGCVAEEMREDLRALIQHIMGRGYENFAIHVGERLPSDFGSKDIEDLASFLASMLQQSPGRRSSTRALLEDQFL
ncbi:hypothetical protein N7489_005667, partial [Penicillium chrysogenum]|uniref:uncharacterized protein n=1 Tax=Penicillium chrysogenum TaxID=5076 RepID=UPI0024DF0D52